MSVISNLGAAFGQVVRQHEAQVALDYPATGVQVRYGELSRLVDHIADVLWHMGLRQGQVAALFHDKSPGAYAAMLACLRLGIIYTNLDPDSPWERVRKMIAICQPSVMVNAFEVMPFGDVPDAVGLAQVLHLRHLPALPTRPVSADWPPVNGSAPAYIMFTSGSTGMPKGAVMSHANVLGFIQWAQNRFSITRNDVLTSVNPIYFDNSVFDFYTAIFSGASLVPFTPSQVRDARWLLRLIDAAHCTLWFSVPSLLVYLLTTRALSDKSFATIRKIIFGGEGFPKPKLKQLYDWFGGRAELENVYGPTECTCICSAKTIAADDFDDMQSLTPLGFLAPNFGYEILQQDATAPDFGELFLLGPQVGLGYYNDAERTGRAFVQNPCHTRYRDVGYRTGDLVLKDARGVLHFKGRSDFQIKHMGYRIELEEIEAAMNTLPEVRECAVIYQNLGGGMGQILAFAALLSPLSPGEVLNKLAASLPSYMLPRRVMVLDALPKNANGKIDRTRLQAAAML